MKSRAAVFLEPFHVETRELAVPNTPPPGGAIMKIVANGICGSDLDLYSGRLSMPAGRPIPAPMVMGHEPVGRISAIDSTAARMWNVKEGDRIAVESKIACGTCDQCVNGRRFLCRNSQTYSLIPLSTGSGLWGGMADYMVLQPGSFIFKIPDQMTDDDAALFNAVGNAVYWTLEAGKVQAGDLVLVLGGGQRGLACVAAAREAGAAQIIVTGLSRDAHKLALAPEFGATHTINVETTDTVEEVRKITNGAGVDVAIDTVPDTAAPIMHAIEALRPGGRLIIAGVRNKPVDGFTLERFRAKQLHMVGTSGTTSWAVANAIRIVAEHRYPWEKLHSHHFGLDDVGTAIRTLGGEGSGPAPIHITIKP